MKVPRTLWGLRFYARVTLHGPSESGGKPHRNPSGEARCPPRANTLMTVSVQNFPLVLWRVKLISTVVDLRVEKFRSTLPVPVTIPDDFGKERSLEGTVKPWFLPSFFA
jgi:hypothetical protein